MSRDSFPTFRKIGRWVTRIIRSPAVQKRFLAAVGGFFVTALVILSVNYFVPPRYQSDPWHLYLWSLGGFAGALFGAWGLKHGWMGPLYGAMLGLYFGGVLFYLHGSFGLMSTGYCVLFGDRVAGLLFFVLSTVGGCVGTWLAGVPIPFLRGPATRKRILLWLLAIGGIVSFWLVLYYKWWLVWHE